MSNFPNFVQNDKIPTFFALLRLVKPNYSHCFFNDSQKHTISRTFLGNVTNIPQTKTAIT